MEFFCVRSHSLSPQALEDTVKVILQTPHQLRTDNDHNKVFSYFQNDIYLNTLQKTRGIGKLMLSTSVLQGIRAYPNEELTQQVRQMQYLTVLEGHVKADDSKVETNQYMVDKQIKKVDGFLAGANGCFIAYLSRERYQEFLSYPLEEIKERVEQLKQFIPFKEMAYTHLLFIASNTKVRTYRFRQEVFTFSDESSHMYCILKGSFELSRRFSTVKHKNETILLAVEAGQTIGEDEVLLSCLRETEMRSLGCQNLVIEIPSGCLLDVLEEYPELKQELMTIIEGRRAYNHVRAIEIVESHHNFEIKHKSNSKYMDEGLFFPSLNLNLNTPEKKPVKESNYDLGFEVLSKAYILNQPHPSQTEKQPRKYSKETILRSLGARYLVAKLHQKQQEYLIQNSRSMTQPDQLPLKENKPIRFPLIYADRKKPKKHNRIAPKHQLNSSLMIPDKNQHPINRIFSLET